MSPSDAGRGDEEGESVPSRGPEADARVIRARLFLPPRHAKARLPGVVGLAVGAPLLVVRLAFDLHGRFSIPHLLFGLAVLIVGAVAVRAAGKRPWWTRVRYGRPRRETADIGADGISLEGGRFLAFSEVLGVERHEAYFSL